jgi:hypothetical protein
MDLQTFEASLAGPSPPAGLPPLVEALWHERRGDWDRAHEITQDLPGDDAAWVHAYLHRREGDESNAAYWYRQAGRPVMSNAVKAFRETGRGSLDDEWRAIVVALLTVERTPMARVTRD